MTTKAREYLLGQRWMTRSSAIKANPRSAKKQSKQRKIRKFQETEKIKTVVMESLSEAVNFWRIPDFFAAQGVKVSQLLSSSVFLSWFDYTAAEKACHHMSVDKQPTLGIQRARGRALTKAAWKPRGSETAPSGSDPTAPKGSDPPRGSEAPRGSKEEAERDPATSRGFLGK